MEINHIFVVLTSFSNIKSYSKICMQGIHKRKNGNTKQMIKKENGGNLKMKKVKERKGIKGITLIALVITILFSYDEKLKFSNSKGFLLQTI